jgi:predicted dehydrogenase
MNRRQFITTSGTGIAGLLAARPMFAAVSANPTGANSEIRVAVIGFNAHGKSHIRAFKSMPGVRLVGLCDVDDEVLRAQAAELDREGIKVKTWRDMRAVFDSNEVDAVSMSTPNHWHALGTVWACQAGKDVCVEKPISHCIWEGRKMVEAARKYDRIVQADLDARSGGRLLDEAGEFLRSGAIGKIVSVRCWNYIRRPGIGKVVGPQKVPSHIDYNLWTGPAPLLPLMREKFHYEWHWQWPTGNGEIANNGSHNLDQVRWVLGKTGLPRTVMAFGGRYGYIDDGQTPNTHTAIYDYDGITVIYEARGLSTSATSENMDDFIGETVNGKPVVRPHNNPGRNSGQVVFCERGYFMGGVVYDNDGNELKRFEPGERGDGPQANFIKGVRSRKPADLKIDVLEGHLSVTFCHMGNVPIQCGALMPFSDAKSAVARTPHGEKAFDRMTRHLVANGVDAARAMITVGPTLTMDAQTERFVGD